MTVKNLSNKWHVHECGKGFTLIELLVALAIAGAIMGVMTMTIITMMQVGPKNNAQAIVFTQVQNAGLWISRDTMMAENVTTTKPDVFIELTCADIVDGSYYIDYVFDGTTLKRQIVEIETGNIIDEIQVAEYINPPITEYVEPPHDTSAIFSTSDNITKLTFTIKSVFNGANTYRTYFVTPRLM